MLIEQPDEQENLRWFFGNLSLGVVPSASLDVLTPGRCVAGGASRSSGSSCSRPREGAVYNHPVGVHDHVHHNVAGHNSERESFCRAAGGENGDASSAFAGEHAGEGGEEVGDQVQDHSRFDLFDRTEDDRDQVECMNERALSQRFGVLELEPQRMVVCPYPRARRFAQELNRLSEIPSETSPSHAGQGMEQVVRSCGGSSGISGWIHHHDQEDTRGKNACRQQGCWAASSTGTGAPPPAGGTSTGGRGGAGVLPTSGNLRQNLNHVMYKVPSVQAVEEQNQKLNYFADAEVVVDEAASSSPEQKVDFSSPGGASPSTSSSPTARNRRATTPQPPAGGVHPRLRQLFNSCTIAAKRWNQFTTQRERQKALKNAVEHDDANMVLPRASCPSTTRARAKALLGRKHGFKNITKETQAVLLNHYNRQLKQSLCDERLPIVLEGQKEHASDEEDAEAHEKLSGGGTIGRDVEMEVERKSSGGSSSTSGPSSSSSSVTSQAEDHGQTKSSGMISTSGLRDKRSDSADSLPETVVEDEETLEHFCPVCGKKFQQRVVQLGNNSGSGLEVVGGPCEDGEASQVQQDSCTCCNSPALVRQLSPLPPPLAHLAPLSEAELARFLTDEEWHTARAARRGEGMHPGIEKMIREDEKVEAENESGAGGGREHDDSSASPRSGTSTPLLNKTLCGCGCGGADNPKMTGDGFGEEKSFEDFFTCDDGRAHMLFHKSNDSAQERVGGCKMNPPRHTVPHAYSAEDEAEQKSLRPPADGAGEPQDLDGSSHPPHFCGIFSRNTSPGPPEEDRGSASAPGDDDDVDEDDLYSEADSTISSRSLESSFGGSSNSGASVKSLSKDLCPRGKGNSFSPPAVSETESREADDYSVPKAEDVDAHGRPYRGEFGPGYYRPHPTELPPCGTM
ncbi:unnamed protein product [Amoebophrya sp. A120]|nr:unnamed protein product [Amoebophrya sp. A120]|eukprot:GSA120T00005961001.1